MDFGGFDSSRILSSMGGIPRPTGNFPEVSSQRILVGVILVGSLVVPTTSLPGRPDTDDKPPYIIRIMIMIRSNNNTSNNDNNNNNSNI